VPESTKRIEGTVVMSKEVLAALIGGIAVVIAAVIGLVPRLTKSELPSGERPTIQQSGESSQSGAPPAESTPEPTPAVARVTYALEQLPLTFSGLTGLRVGDVPGLGSRRDCPEDGEAGCIVGYRTPGDTTGKMLATIVVSQAGRTAFTATTDPREFVAPRLQPGSYTVSMFGDEVDTMYIFQQVPVMSRQATLMPISVSRR
jgi:hypothetical protein